MKFLEKLGFTKEDIQTFENSVADVMLDMLAKNKKLVKANMEYLKELGVKNLHDLFFQYYELFLIDHSNFESIFNKYDREDLVEKINKSADVVEYL